MSRSPELITFSFGDETAWRSGVAAFIRAHPNAYFNLGQNLEIVVPRALEGWVRDHLAVRNPSEPPARNGRAVWKARGKGISERFDGHVHG